MKPGIKPEEQPYGPLLGHCAHLSKERLRSRMARFDLTPTQTHVLLYLTENGPSAQSMLAEDMKVKAPTANGILDRMEEKGLVVRSVDEKDARRRLIRLTEKGAGLVEDLKTQFDRAEEEILRGFDAAEQALLRKYLIRIIENLEVTTL